MSQRPMNERKIKIDDPKENKLDELRSSLASLRNTLASLELQKFDSEPLEDHSAYNTTVKTENIENLGHLQPKANPVPPRMLHQYQSSGIFNGTGLSLGTSPPRECHYPLTMGLPSPVHREHYYNGGNPAQNFCYDEQFGYMHIPNVNDQSYYSPQLRAMPHNYDMLPHYDQFMMQTQAHEAKKTVEERKSKVCRHFLRGFCKLGDRCNFTHSLQINVPSDQIVFLGGLPMGMTSSMLVNELKKSYGVEIQGEPQIISNYAPRVGFSSQKDAEKLVNLKKITILNTQVDVRPFKDRNKTSDEESMVFLGGLPDDTNIEELIAQMHELGYSVVNRPRLGQGYARNVQLDSPRKANDLIRKKVIILFDKTIDIRPYVNIYADKLLRKQNRFIPQNSPKTTNRD
jgi:hypothetical protein